MSQQFDLDEYRKELASLLNQCLPCPNPKCDPGMDYEDPDNPVPDEKKGLYMDEGGGWGHYKVICLDCGMHGPSASAYHVAKGKGMFYKRAKKKAVKNWNELLRR